MALPDDQEVDAAVRGLWAFAFQAQLPRVLTDAAEPTWQGEACGINPLLRCLRCGEPTGSGYFLTPFRRMPTAKAEGSVESKGSVGKVSARRVLGYLQIDTGPWNPPSACSEVFKKLCFNRVLRTTSNTRRYMRACTTCQTDLARAFLQYGAYPEHGGTAYTHTSPCTGTEQTPTASLRTRMRPPTSVTINARCSLWCAHACEETCAQT